MALIERHEAAQEFQEYCAALSPWMVYNTNRRKGAKFEQPQYFMFRAKTKEKGRPHAVADPAAASVHGARYALPGERFPSKRAPGQTDTTIQRFDAYMKAVQGTEIPPHG